jgi:hypothetical protein
MSDPAGQIRTVATEDLSANSFSRTVYGEAETSLDGFLDSVRAVGVLEPICVTAGPRGFRIISGHRRWACARALGLAHVPCRIVEFENESAEQLAVLDANLQRTKTFSQVMREADALAQLLAPAALKRRMANLRQFSEPEDQVLGTRTPTTDQRIASRVGLGSRETYRQARAIWSAMANGDIRAGALVAELDAKTKTIHAAYKDLRRRTVLSTSFKPTPYDVWNFRHDRAFGIQHPGSVPAKLIAHLVHYFTMPGDLVVDPMAGGGTTLDVCEALGRRCRAYDRRPVRPDIAYNDVKAGIPPDCAGASLIFLDPPYHTQAALADPLDETAQFPLSTWIAFLQHLAETCHVCLARGGHVALLVANQTEKDVPAGYGYLDHAFYGYIALLRAGFVPVRRISCPMDGRYLPQDVLAARREGRLLGQVRDLLVMRKPNLGLDLKPRIPGVFGVGLGVA